MCKQDSKDSSSPDVEVDERHSIECAALAASKKPEQPVPDPEKDPHGYIRYVLDDLRSLVRDAKPSDEALLSRFDCIERVLASSTSPQEQR